MTRLAQLALLASFPSFSWLAMQVVHEAGHVLGAAVSGGTVHQVVLHPSTLSRTDVFPNPHPLVVVWAGPVVGAMLPLGICLIAAALRSPGLCSGSSPGSACS
jgi:hypothetical protein